MGREDEVVADEPGRAEVEDAGPSDGWDAHTKSYWHAEAVTQRERAQLSEATGDDAGARAGWEFAARAEITAFSMVPEVYVQLRGNLLLAAVEDLRRAGDPGAALQLIREYGRPETVGSASDLLALHVRDIEAHPERRMLLLELDEMPAVRVSNTGGHSERTTGGGRGS
jgi:hypothetical protein